MRKIWTKSAAVTATTGALVVGMAGMASASTGDHAEPGVDQSETQVDDVGNVSLDDILNGSIDVDDLASDNEVLHDLDANVLNGVDADVNDILSGVLSGNDTDADVDTDASSSGSDSGTDSGGLLGLLD